jgi:hypothetical protein
MRFLAPFSANIDGISRHNLLKRIQTKSTPSLNACLFCASCACRGNVATWQSPFLEQSARDYLGTWRRFFLLCPHPVIIGSADSKNCKKTWHSVLSFSYACPEPVLVK